MYMILVKFKSNNNQSEINKRLEFFPDINKIDLKTELNVSQLSLSNLEQIVFVTNYTLIIIFGVKIIWDQD